MDDVYKQGATRPIFSSINMLNADRFPIFFYRQT